MGRKLNEMAKILLVAEGVTDFGGQDYKKKAGEFIDRSGALQVLIRNCVDNQDLEIKCASRSEIKKVQVFERRLNKKDQEREKLTRSATMKECDSIIYHMDVDTCKFDERYDQIDELLSTARKKGFKCMPAAPMRMIESWLLADKNAFPSEPKKPALPKKPEKIWGKKSDPKSDFPKHYLDNVLKQFHMESNRETFAELASKASPDVLCQKCPISFKRFYDDLQDLFSAEPETA